MNLLDSGFLKFTLAHEVSVEPEIFHLDNGTFLELWDTGVLRCVPASSSSDSQLGAKRVLISCGVHGNETAPMEIVDQLVGEIINGDLLLGCEVLFILGNPTAANQAKRFVEENLNRLFSGAHKAALESLESRRARDLEHYVKRFYELGEQARIHYDLHTAIRGSEFEKFVVYPYREKANWSQAQLGFLEKCGLQAVLLSNKPSTTFSYFTDHEFGADAFTVELGSVAPFGQNDMNRFTKIVQGLRNLLHGQENFSESPVSIRTFAVIEEVIKRTEAFELHIPDDARNFSEYPKGTVLASDEGYEYRTKVDGERFVFPIKNVPPGNRAMLVVAPIEL